MVSVTANSADATEEQPQNLIETEIGMLKAFMLSYIVLISFQPFEDVEMILLHELCRTSQWTRVGCNLQLVI